jgi:beta-1,4-N-acetylglucosaminyltransferase
MIYVESIARVESLSLSGKLLRPIVDHFVVQWKPLKERYPKAEYYGLLL